MQQVHACPLLSEHENMHTAGQLQIAGKSEPHLEDMRRARARARARVSVCVCVCVCVGWWWKGGRGGGHGNSLLLSLGALQSTAGEHTRMKGTDSPDQDCYYDLVDTAQSNIYYKGPSDQAHFNGMADLTVHELPAIHANQWKFMAYSRSKSC